MRALALWLVWLGGLACAAGSGRLEVAATAPPVPWTHLEVAEDPDDFQFLIVGDRTGGMRPGVFESAVDKINLLRPAFVVSVGDLIQGYTEDAARLEAEWAEFDALVARLGMPFFYVPGNHDYTNEVMAHEWARRFGPSFYHFRYRDVLFLVVNSELFSSYVNPGHPVPGEATPEDQLRFVEQTLAAHSDARWTLVFVHQPLWDNQGEQPHWERVETLLADRPYTVFAGHFHNYTKHVRHDRRYLTLATTGGGSALRGIDRGEFDHVAWVTMSDAGPVVANLMLDGIHDEDVRTAEMRALLGPLDTALTTLPLLVPDERFEAGEQRFRVHNKTDLPLTVRGRFEPGPDLLAIPRELERTLAPGARETLAVELRARAPAPVSELTPGLARWTAEVSLEGRTLQVEQTAWLIPERRFPLGRPARPVAVDADLSEWGKLRFALEDWPDPEGGRAQASLRFDVAADADALYFALDVSDPTPVFSPALGPEDQDGVALVLDARPEPARSQNAGLRRMIDEGVLAQLLVAWLAPVDPAPDPALDDVVAPLPEGLRRAVRIREGGYTAELSVPASFLEDRAGGAWDGVRLNVVLQDFEVVGGRGREHAWRPESWVRAPVSIRGSGSFVRTR